MNSQTKAPFSAVPSSPMESLNVKVLAPEQVEERQMDPTNTQKPE